MGRRPWSELERGEALAGDVVGGGGVHDSAVVVDDLDVVPVGVEDEGAVVAGVVDRALAGRAVVPVARGERGSVELAHGRVVGGGEGEVDVLGQRPRVVDQGEAVVRAGELDAGRLVVAERDAGVRRDRRVEAPRLEWAGQACSRWGSANGRTCPRREAGAGPSP
jgi:hypothetical protein